MKIIKLGGSLLSASALKGCLEKIAGTETPTVIVPGGGVFADQVRVMQVEWNLDDRAAHAMAILAMQQMAWLIHSIQPEFTIQDDVNALAGTDKVAVWSPTLRDLDRAGIPASWEITSDSLSAWLAHRLQADELIVVKSCVVPAGIPISQLQQIGVLDAGFLQFSEPNSLKISILNKDHFLQSACLDS